MRDDLRRTCSRDLGRSIVRRKGINRRSPRASFRPCSNRSASCSRRASSARAPKIQHEYIFVSLTKGSREEKFAELANCPLVDRTGWTVHPVGVILSYPLQPVRGRRFRPSRIFSSITGSGVMPGRTWIIAPDIDSLNARWTRLISEKDTARKKCCFTRTGWRQDIFEEINRMVWPATNSGPKPSGPMQEACNRADHAMAFGLLIGNGSFQTHV